MTWCVCMLNESMNEMSNNNMSNHDDAEVELFFMLKKKVDTKIGAG